ncbi:MAG TPA: PDZ domain-containing protein, partial [Longimicrobiaceae bacterium]|nr:PDZ domain-containing protein [Longimicrobiaceae bacterium]
PPQAAGSAAPPPPLSLGIRTKEEAGRTLVGSVATGSPAHRAGLNAGDEILALDGLRTSARDLPVRIMEREEGEVVEVAVFRRDELLRIPVRLERAPPVRGVLRRVKDPTPLQTAIYESWLGSGSAVAPSAGREC